MKFLAHLALLAATASARTMTMHAAERPDWVPAGKAAATESHTLLFAVAQQNLDQVKSLFFELSDPASPRFREWLTNDEVSELTANKEGTNAVVEFLVQHGATLTSMTKNGEYIRASAPVDTWNKLLNADFIHFEHRKRVGAAVPEVRNILRTMTYEIPSALDSAVAFVGFATNLPPAIAEKAMPKRVTDEKVINAYWNKSIADGTTTPALLNEFYSIESNVGSAEVGQAVFETGQFWSAIDLDEFQQYFGLPAQEVATEEGGSQMNDNVCSLAPNACTEANLDLQYMMAVANTSPMTYWNVDNNYCPFLAWAEAVADSSSPPLVHSISYGSLENEMDPNTLDAFDTEVQKLGLQGVSVFVSSGDDGVSNFQCGCEYVPSYPASSPYVTAVGATQGPEFATDEVACSSDTGGLITTGGGFSTHYEMPSYQADAANGYFDAVDTTPETGYASGRGYPDISLIGHNYLVAVGGYLYEVSGTSCSSPAVAGMTTLVNSKLAKSGRRAGVGFVNPLIYSTPSTFNDITEGNNNCCAGQVNPTCCDVGFNAASGWDPLTGHGSVDYATYESLLMGK
jgi:tripeptidyl-peptidase-1